MPDELVVIDAARLRMVQAATEGPWKPALGTSWLQHSIHVEPSGRAVATNDKVMVVADDVFAPIETAVDIVLQSKVTKTARSGIIRGDALTTDKGDSIEVLYPDIQFPNYEAVLKRIDEGVEYPMSDYGMDFKAIYDVISAHPSWPKETYFRFRHLSKLSVQIETGLPGVTFLMSLAMKVRR